MSARKRTRISSNASISADSAPPNESPESLTSNINNDVQNETVSDGVAQDHTKAKEVNGDNNGDNDNDDDDDDEYEEALVYVELPAFANQHYLSQAKRRIVIQGLCGGGVPSLLVDGSAEFKGEHTINLGSNHFFECSSSSNSSSAGSSTLEYKGHSIKTTEFTLSKILRSGVDQNENDNASDQENIDNDDDNDDNDNASGQENAEDEEDDGDNASG